MRCDQTFPPIIVTRWRWRWNRGDERRYCERTRRIIGENYPVVQRWAEGHGDTLTHIPPAAGAIAWFRYALDKRSDELVEELRQRKSAAGAGEPVRDGGHLRIALAATRRN